MSFWRQHKLEARFLLYMLKTPFVIRDLKRLEPSGLAVEFPMYFYICGQNLKSLQPPCQRLWRGEFEVLWSFGAVLMAQALRQKVKDLS